jgi:teichuronic acid biosynthesis glycosyltransferase TuaG
MPIDLSIILPYYKKRKFIKETLISIINQTFKNHELIIIYDQKHLGDLDYIKGILKKKIRYQIIINNKNLGVGKSRNIGIKKSTSKYIAFCDADDVWHKSKSQIQLRIMKEKKLDFTHTNYHIINSNNKILGKMKAKSNLKYEDLMKSCDIALSSVIIKSSLLKQSNNFGDTKTKEDFILWLKLSKRIKIYGINKFLLSWRKTENSLSSNISQKIKDAFIVYKKIENKNFLVTCFFVLRLSIYYLIKRINQKIL